MSFIASFSPLSFSPKTHTNLLRKELRDGLTRQLALQLTMMVHGLESVLVDLNLPMKMTLQPDRRQLTGPWAIVTNDQRRPKNHVPDSSSDGEPENVIPAPRRLPDVAQKIQEIREKRAKEKLEDRRNKSQRSNNKAGSKTFIIGGKKKSPLKNGRNSRIASPVKTTRSNFSPFKTIRSGDGHFNSRVPRQTGSSLPGKPSSKAIASPKRSSATAEGASKLVEDLQIRREEVAKILSFDQGKVIFIFAFWRSSTLFYFLNTFSSFFPMTIVSMKRQMTRTTITLATVYLMTRKITMLATLLPVSYTHLTLPTKRIV